MLILLVIGEDLKKKKKKKGLPLVVLFMNVVWLLPERDDSAFVEKVSEIVWFIVSQKTAVDEQRNNYCD